MSKFFTEINTNVQSVINKLPATAYVHSVELTPDYQVKIVWDYDKERTPFTFPVEKTLTQIDEMKGVSAPQPEAEPSPVVTTEAVEDEKAKVDKRTKAYKESQRNVETA